MVNIAPREPITEARLAPEGTAGGLSAVIPEGYRAMTVKVDDVVGISGFIMPGTLVDVVVVIDPAEKAGMQDPISKIVLQNIKVLANGQNIDKPESEREANERQGRHPSGYAGTGGAARARVKRRQAATHDAQLDRPGRRANRGHQQARPARQRTRRAGARSGALKSEQPKPVAKPAGRVVREPKPVAVVPPAPPRAQVEMIEGAKKRNVDFP